MTSTEPANTLDQAGNSLPIAQDDAITTNQNAIGRGNVITELGIDTDPDGDKIKVVGVGTASGQVGAAVAGSDGGLFTIQANGALRFDPDGAFDGLGKGETALTTVSYTISDGKGGTATATVTATVVGRNDPPEAAAAAEATQGIEDTAVAGQLLAGSDPDGDRLTYHLVDGSATHGSVVVNEDGSYRFVPERDFNGTAMFQYVVSDGRTFSAAKTVSIEFAAANDAPMAMDDRGYQATVDTRIVIEAASLLANDNDPDAGDVLTLVSVSGRSAKGATVSLDPVTGQIVYAADSSAFDGLGSDGRTTDTFTYTVKDSAGSQSTATVTIDILGAGPPGSILGTSRSETMFGTGRDDAILGLGGDDHLFGHAGNDLLLGGTGNDTLRGEDGNDTLSGGDGNDTLFGAGGSDLLFGGSGNDQLYGEDGNDTLSGGDGNDLLVGAGGNDQLVGDAGDDTLRGEDGADMLDGGDGHDTLSGGGGDDQIFGGLGRDSLRGEDGNDTLMGEEGADLLYGAGGDDVLFGGTGADSLHGEDGNDRLNGEGGNDLLYGAAGNDTMSGGAGSDTLLGSDGSDHLSGDQGDDILDGGTGNDVLVGGRGRDVMNGGHNDDLFKFGRGDSGLGDEADVIQGFEGIGTSNGDRIDLSDLFDGLLTFKGSQAFDGLNQVRVTDRGSDTVIQVNYAGTIDPDFEVVVQDGHVTAAAWRAADFVF
ncbi:Ig-like domain-containing protein [Geminicoccus roseus]|uniref:Ig-like domain-containing protein n=1 Tax=Geminicoccus roseus TaxID=404900 RepID=UPI00040DCAF3|nr:Ig-like domain-containing protein [Geminicoccus roseus]